MVNMEVDKVNNTNIKLMQVAQPFGQIYSSFKWCFPGFLLFFAVFYIPKRAMKKFTSDSVRRP